MIIEGENFKFEDTFETPITVADSWVMQLHVLCFVKTYKPICWPLNQNT